MTKVIFACVHNAGRSQMAAGWFRALANNRAAYPLSAGTHPAARVHPVVVEVMREVGIDLTTVRPQLLTAELAQGASLLVTMGCGDECPFVPGARIEDWPLRDPKDLDIDSVRQIRDEIRERVIALLEVEGWAAAEGV